MPIFRNTFHTLAILLLTLQLTTKVSTAEIAFPGTISDITIHTVNNPNTFTVEIPQGDYDHTYNGSVIATQVYPGPSCSFFPATFNPALSASYTVPDPWPTPGANYHIDNFGTYRFISKTTTSSVQALGYGEIKSNPVGHLSGNVQMVIDQTGTGTMYVFNPTGGYTYDLLNFDTNVNLATPVIPDMTGVHTFAFPSAPPTPFLDARYHASGKIYIRAGTEIGYIELPFTNDVYTPVFTQVAGKGPLRDFAIRGDYIYALQEEALFVRKIGVPAQQEEFNLRRGRFIEVTTNSIIIVGDTTSIIYEYFIVDVTTPPIPTIEQEITFNRHIPVQFGNLEVLDVESDEHYLYIATTKDTLVMRHSIPKDFSASNSFQEVQTMWPGDNLKFVSSTLTGANTFMAFRGVNAYEYTMNVHNPYLWCIASRLPGCKFTSTIESYQRRCPGPNVLTDPHDVCKLTQNLIINVLESSTACPDSTKPAEGLAVTPGLVYKSSGFVSENGEVQQTHQKTPYVRKARPSNFTVEPHYNQTRNIERAKNYTGRHNNIFDQATPVDQSSTRISLPPTGSPSSSSAKTEEQPVMKTETMTVESDSEKNGDIREMINENKELMNENKELMNGLMISMVALFVILSLFIVFVIWYFLSKQKNGDTEKSETVQEEERSGFVVIPDTRKKPKIDFNVSQLHTFVDESKTQGDIDISRIEFGQ